MVPRQMPAVLNPLTQADDPAIHDLGHLLYRGLMRLDSQGYPVADLATGVTISGDGLTYRMSIGGGARWSDGRAISGEDVRATALAAQSSSHVPTALRDQWRGVTMSASGSAITFVLPSPRAAFAVTLAQTPVLPFAGRSESAADNFQIGPGEPTSGAYLVKIVNGDAIRLEANPQARVAPLPGVVVLRIYADFGAAAAALRNGDVDGVLATTDAERRILQGVPGVSAHDIAMFGFVDLMFNQRVAALADPVVRQAIAESIDRTALIDTALNGAAIPQAGPIPAGIAWAASPDIPHPRVDTADTQLDAAGWLRGPDNVRARGGQKLMLTLVVPDVAPFGVVGHVIAAQLARLGIAVTVSAAPAPGFLDDVLVPGRFQLAIASWDNGPDPDVSAFWRSGAQPPHGFNIGGGTGDPFLDEDLDGLATLTSRAARTQAAQQVSAQFADDNPAVILYAPEATLYLRTVIRGATVPTIGGTAAHFDALPSWRLG